MKLLNNGVKMTQKNIRRNYWLGKYLEDANKRQKAYQQLSSAQLPTEYEASKLIGEHLSRMPYNSDVTRRIKEEPTLQSKKGGSKKKKRKTKKKQRKTKKK